MDYCKHVKSISHVFSAQLLNPAKWICADCATTDSIWACLVCGHMACGRYTNGHAENHFQLSQHAISFEINEGYAFCYKCDEYVMIDNSAGDLRTCREVLKVIRQQPTSDNNQRRLIRRNKQAHNKDSARIDDTPVDRSNIINAVISYRKMMRLGRCFTAWRDYTYSKRHPNMYEPASVDRKQTLVKTASAASVKASPSNMCLASTSNNGARVPLGVTGLRNLGNTCYMNSVLQVLSNLKEFREYFLEYCPFKPVLDSSDACAAQNSRQQNTHDATNGTKRRRRHNENATSEEQQTLSHEVHSLLNIMWSGKLSLVIPQGFLEAVWNKVPSFKGYQQQDAQEFLAELLERLKEEQSSLEDEENGGVKCKREKLTSKRSSRVQNLVSNLFNGKTESRVTCQQCGRTTLRVEGFSDLSLEFPEHYQRCQLTSFNLATDSCHVTEMLQSFTAVENLGFVYQCEQCNGPMSEEEAPRRRHLSSIASGSNGARLTEAHKRIQVCALPKILRLHLKRFRWHERNNRVKISIHVQFDDRLDMMPFCTADLTSDVSKTQYQLVGVVMHHGRGFTSGHYTSYCWHERAGFWIHCNDARLQLVNLNDVLSSQAYILFYSRIDDDTATKLSSSTESVVE